jgi:hypothetical protein
MLIVLYQIAHCIKYYIMYKIQMRILNLACIVVSMQLQANIIQYKISSYHYGDNKILI